MLTRAPILPRPFFLFLLILMAAAAIISPGLLGVFLLDDDANLQDLGAINQANSWYAWFNFAFSGRSGPAGRPLSLLTFSLQHASWPGFPLDFKLFNLAIHLINGLLLHLVIMKTGVLASWPSQRTKILALLAPTLWLLHPMQVSTVFYVVQRMTLLSATFILVGTGLYLHGRRLITDTQISQSKQNLGVIIAAIGIIGGGSLAVLAKENGALLPLYILTLETTLLAKHPWPERLKKWRFAGLHGPWILMAAYLLTHWQSVMGHYASRTFTLPERLLTQTRVVTDYLRLIVAPKFHELGLFHDDYSTSHSLTQPPSTLWCLVFLAALLVTALALRNHFSWISFGILWFFAGHLMESTFLPLELYFEHRNYLPLFGIAFIAAWAVQSLYYQTNQRRTRMLSVGLGALLLGQWAFMSHDESQLWGDPIRQALIWSEENPKSARAVLNWGNRLYMFHRVDEAEQLLQHYGQLQTDDATSLLIQLKIHCDYPKRPILIDDAYVQEVSRRRGGNKATIIGILDFTTKIIESGRCTAVKPETMLAILQGMMDNPAYGGPITRNSLHLLTGRLYALQGNLNQAMEHFDRAQTYYERLDTYQQQVKWLASAGLYADARNYLEKASAMPEKISFIKLLRKKELQPFYQMVSDMEAADRKQHREGKP
ncbi:MAG: hypothetical protein HQL74_11810 [Magnetococcales bacterium]|nr:hypothetical protein [Magnetococcales bacterium]